MVEEEVFACPLCGAPYRALVPSGVVQVKCQYCGGTVLVPPRMGGVSQRCPNHPDALAVGLCNDCDTSYCDSCLFIYMVRDGKLHICSKCYKNRNSMKLIGATFSSVLSLTFFLLFFVLLANPPSPNVGVPLPLLFPAFAFLALFVTVFQDVKKKPLSVHEAIEQRRKTQKDFLKKCVKCDREIPIASEECPHCGARQPEHVNNK